MELLICGLLNLGVPMTSSGEIFGILMSYSCLFLTLLFLPSLSVYIATRTIPKLKKKLFRAKWGAIYQNLSPKKINLLYMPLFVVRRLSFIGNSIILTSYPTQQIQVLLYINFLAINYFLHCYPLRMRQLNRIELFNEAFVSIISLHMLVFTDWVTDEDTKFLMGWSMVIFLAVMVTVNLQFIILHGGK